MNRRRVVFLTGTRADFGKLKSLIAITQKSERFDVHIFATGMHMNAKYGKTVDEIYKAGFDNVYPFINHDTVEHMDRTLARTIDGFSHYISEIKPDLIVVHGDRSEALAGAIVGSLNNILVAHIEGGEISGTIDELIRHSVSKMSHIHLVANKEAKKRLLQLGEKENSIHIIGSPDLDLMRPESLPNIVFVKQYYEISFKSYAVLLFHPVTTEYDRIREYAKNVVDAVLESGLNYVVIYPNNDLGSLEILQEYKRLENNSRFRIFPSLRFEYFLQLMRYARFVIGNSSAAVMEAPYYNIPAVDIGSRQHNRANLPTLFHASYEKESILRQIKRALRFSKRGETAKSDYFGDGRSDKKFFELLVSDRIWKTSHQKQFQELRIDA